MKARRVWLLALVTINLVVTANLQLVHAQSDSGQIAAPPDLPSVSTGDTTGDGGDQTNTLTDPTVPALTPTPSPSASQTSTDTSQQDGGEAGVCDPANKRMNFDHVAACLDPKNDAFPWIVQLWKWSLSLVNIFAVVVLIVMAFANILYPLKILEPYRIRQVLPGFIWGIILANLSMLICRAVVTFADILMQQTHLLNKLSTSTTILQALYRSWGIVPSYLKFGVISAKFIDPNPQNAAMLYQLLVSTLLVYIPLIALACLAFIFYFRFLVIFILTAISPLAFAAIMFPATEKYLGQWWDQFWKWTFGGVASYLLLFIAAQIKSNSAYLGANAGTLIDLIPYALTLILVWLAVQAPFKMGGALAAAWGGLGKAGLGKLWGATKFTAGAAFGAGRLGLQHTTRWNDNDWMKLKDQPGKPLTWAERGKWLLGHAGNIVSKPGLTYYGTKKGLELKKSAHEGFVNKAVNKSGMVQLLAGKSAALKGHADSFSWLHNTEASAIEGELQSIKDKNGHLSDDEWHDFVKATARAEPKDYNALMNKYKVSPRNFQNTLDAIAGMSQAQLRVTRGTHNRNDMIDAYIDKRAEEFAFKQVAREEKFKAKIRREDDAENRTQAHGGTSAGANGATPQAHAGTAPATPPPTAFANSSGTNNAGTASTPPPSTNFTNGAGTNNAAASGGTTGTAPAAGASVAATVAAVNNRSHINLPATHDAAMRLAIEQAVKHLSNISELNGMHPDELRQRVQKVFQKGVPDQSGVVNDWAMRQELKKQFSPAQAGAVRDKMMTGLAPAAQELGSNKSRLKAGDKIDERRGVDDIFRSHLKAAPAKTNMGEELLNAEQECQKLLSDMPRNADQAGEFVKLHQAVLVKIIPDFQASMSPEDIRGRLQEQILGAQAFRRGFQENLKHQIDEAEQNLASEHAEVRQQVDVAIGSFYRFATTHVQDPTNSAEFDAAVKQSHEVIKRAAEHALIGRGDPEQLKVTKEIIAEIAPDYAAQIRLDDHGASANAVINQLQQGSHLFEKQMQQQLNEAKVSVQSFLAGAKEKYQRALSVGSVTAPAAQMTVSQPVDVAIGSFYRFATNKIKDPSNAVEFADHLHAARTKINEAAALLAKGQTEPQHIEAVQKVIADIAPEYAAKIHLDDGGKSAQALVQSLQQGEQLFREQTTAAIRDHKQKPQEVLLQAQQKYQTAPTSAPASATTTNPQQYVQQNTTQPPTNRYAVNAQSNPPQAEMV